MNKVSIASGVNSKTPQPSQAEAFLRSGMNERENGLGALGKDGAGFLDGQRGFSLTGVPSRPALRTAPQVQCCAKDGTPCSCPKCQGKSMIAESENDSGEMEETPAQEPTAEQTPAEQTPGEQTPAEQAPGEQTPVGASASGPAGSADVAPEEATSTQGPASSLIVDDSATEVSEGQMKKTQFIASVRAEICRMIEPVLGSAGQTSDGCPFLAAWMDSYQKKDVAHIEQTVRKYTPDAASASTAAEYITAIGQRAVQVVQIWVRMGMLSGNLSNVPAAAKVADDPDAVLEELEKMNVVQESGAKTAQKPVVQTKAKVGRARNVDDPVAIQKELGEGQPLNEGVRSRMESAFGASFSHVRTHTDSNAVGLSNRVNARAFTIGNHVAFGSGEYKPGTLLGDGLIAHELAHTLQQAGATGGLDKMEAGATGYDALEKDADNTAVEVMTSLWSGTKKGAKSLAQNAMPRIRSGLRISRCSDKTSDPPVGVSTGPVSSPGSGSGSGSAAPAPAAPAATRLATIKVISSGNKSAGNDKSFPSGHGGDKLGPLNDEVDGITVAEATGKVEIEGTLSAGVAAAGLDIKREIIFKDFSNGSLSDSSAGRDDTSFASFKDLTPDANQKIYDIDGPTVGNKFRVNHTKETYNNFTQWVTQNGTQVSDKVTWHYQARVDDDLDAASKPRNKDTELNDVGSGHITIPSAAKYTTR